MEVGPRDGLQNEKKWISMADRLRLVKMLAETGLETIEGGSFVAEKYVPQVGYLRNVSFGLDWRQE